MRRTLSCAAVVLAAGSSVGFAAAPLLGPPIDYFPPTLSPPSLAQGDIDGDGDLDIVLGTFLDSKVAWLENTNPATHAMVTHDISAAGSTIVSPVGVALGDVTGDGALDLVSFSASAAALFYRGANVRQPWVRQTITPTLSNFTVKMADFNNNNKKDILFIQSAFMVTESSGLKIVSVTGTSPFATADRFLLQGGTTAARTIRAATAVDWNHDGLMDILTIEQDRSTSPFGPCVLRLIRNDGGYVFKVDDLATSMPDPSSTALEAGDWTGDGFAEAAYATSSGLTYIKRTGAGSTDFSLQTLPGVTSSSRILVTDYNGDGALDLVSETSSRLDFFLQNAGDFAHSDVNTIFSDSGNFADFSQALIADFSKTGIPDLVYAYKETHGDPSVRRNPGTAGVGIATLSAALDGDVVLQPGALGHLAVHLINSASITEPVVISIRQQNGVVALSPNPVYSSTMGSHQSLDVSLPFKVSETIPDPTAVKVGIDLSTYSYFAANTDVSLGTWGTQDSADSAANGVFDNHAKNIPDSGSVDIPIFLTPAAGTVKSVTVTMLLDHTALSDLSGQLIKPNGTKSTLFSAASLTGGGQITKTYTVSFSQLNTGPFTLRITDNYPQDIGTVTLQSATGTIRRYTGPMTPNIARIRRMVAVQGSETAGDANADTIIDAGDVVTTGP